MRHRTNKCNVVSLILYTLALVGMTACATPGPVGPADRLSQITQSNELKIGINDGFLPFSFQKKDGSWGGFDVELGNLMAAKLGVKPKFVPMPTSQYVKALQDNQVDVVIGGMTMTTQRSRDIYFSKPYLVGGQSILLSRAALDRLGKLDTLSQLMGVGEKLTIAVKKGTSCEDFARAHFAKAKFLTFETRLQAIQAVLEKKADLMVHDYVFVLLWALMNRDKLETQVVPLFGPYTQDYYCIGLPKGQMDLLLWTDNFVDEARGTGALGDIYERYFESGAWLDSLPGVPEQ
ncbi:MAG: transporter substrate-binding domain-containing protein [Deltaproteobacteria bacterium]|nr:transporter substrate-binding domain-containing protein [Deltaproteobacteria bacterium]